MLELAEAFAEIPRALNHLTRHHEALEHPAEGDQLAGFLESAAYRERQLAPQIATWYVLEAAAGRLEVTGGEWKGLPDVAVAVLTARANLVKAAAEELAKAWKSMARGDLYPGSSRDRGGRR